jgi:HEAT repeat protein
MALSAIGSQAREAVPELAAAVLDQNLNVRFFAAKTLANVGPDAKAAIPALIKALATFPGGTPPLDGPQRYYADTRWVAAEALGAVGPGAKDAVPALQKALNDSSPDVRSAAAAALKQIQRN